MAVAPRHKPPVDATMFGITLAELEAYLDEALPAEEMARIEKALRSDPALAAELAAVMARRDAGGLSIGAIWRRHRLSCPTRQQWGAYLLGTLSEDAAGYFRFHLETVGCRYCQANLIDLRRQHTQAEAGVAERRRKYFQSSVGRLPKS